jgi:hypothetical protein
MSPVMNKDTNLPETDQDPVEIEMEVCPSTGVTPNAPVPTGTDFDGISCPVGSPATGRFVTFFGAGAATFFVFNTAGSYIGNAIGFSACPGDFCVIRAGAKGNSRRSYGGFLVQWSNYVEIISTACR